jgi:hypothetical protein
MTTLRDLMNRARRQMDAARAPYADRPTALYAAGSVGDQLRAVVRPQAPQSNDPAIRARDVEPPPPREREFEVPVMPTDLVEDRPQRAVGPVTRHQAGQRDLMRAMLHSPAALRRAIVVNEILRPPVGLRDDHK